MMNETYSLKIAEAIHNHLQENDFKYNFNAERGVFEFLMSGSGGKAKTLIYHILVHDDGFTANARYPVGPAVGDEESLTAMAKFLTRANYCLRNGNFEMDMDDGEINFKVYCCCRGLEAPTDEMIVEVIHCSIAMFDKYEAGILGVLFDGMNDKEAYEYCAGRQGVLMSLLGKELEKRGVAPADDAEEVDGDEFSMDELLRFLAEQEAQKENPDIIDAE